MKTLFTAAALGLIAATSALADPVEGIWKTEVDDGAYAHVTMAPCGAKLCGVISRTFNSTGEYKSTSIGKKIVWDMQAKGSGRYKSGKIWQPSTEKVYKSKMALNGNSLQISGCVGPICKKQMWSRIK